MERESNPMQPMCRSGCGFYGNPATDGLCSVCYKDSLRKKQQPPVTSTPVSVPNPQTSPTFSSSPAIIITNTAQPTVQSLQQPHNAVKEKMSNGKRVMNRFASSFSSATKEKNKKLEKVNERDALGLGPTPRNLVLSSFDEARNHSLPTSDNRERQLQIPSLKDGKKLSLNKKRRFATGYKNKRVKFSETMTSPAILPNHKKALDKKKKSLRTRSNSIVVGTSTGPNLKPKNGPIGNVGVKRKLKAKKNRAISNAVISDSLNNLISNTVSIKKPVDRILTRSPLENALINAAIQMNLSDEDLRASGGSANKILTLHPLVISNPVAGNMFEYAKRDLPNVKTISSGEGQKKNSDRNSPRGSGSSTPNSSSNTNSRVPKPKPDMINTGATSNEDEDPNKKKNIKKKDDKTNNSNSSSSSSSASAENAKRKRKLTEESSANIINENVASTSVGVSAQSAEDEQDKEEDDKDAKKKKNRCAECRKKVGLTGFQCRCGGLYCAVHRYSDKHNCTFNYREHGAQEIRRNNPVVVGEKIQKI